MLTAEICGHCLCLTLWIIKKHADGFELRAGETRGACSAETFLKRRNC